MGLHFRLGYEKMSAYSLTQTFFVFPAGEVAKIFDFCRRGCRHPHAFIIKQEM